MDPDLFDRHPLLRVLLWLVTIIAALLTLGLIWSLILHFSNIILLFFLAWVISFILQPLSTLLEHRHIPRLLAVSLIYLALLAVAAGGILLAIPTIHSEVQFIAGELTTTLTSSNLTNLSNQTVSYLHGLGLSQHDARSLVNQVAGRIPQLTATLANNAVQTTAGLLGAAINLMFNAVIVLVLSFYMMLDGDRLLASWIEKLPPSWLPDIRTLQRHIDQIFGGFLRAQLILALIFGVVTYLVLMILGQPNGLIFAIIAALLMLVPFIGPLLALVPPLSLILLQATGQGVVLKLIVAVLVLGLAEWIVLQFVAPQVMHAQVGLHPLILFAALLIGTEESGVWGALFAGPIAAVLVAVFDTFFGRIRDASGLYSRGPLLVNTPSVAEADTHVLNGHASRANGLSEVPAGGASEAEPSDEPRNHGADDGSPAASATTPPATSSNGEPHVHREPGASETDEPDAERPPGAKSRPIAPRLTRATPNARRRALRTRQIPRPGQ